MAITPQSLIYNPELAVDPDGDLLTLAKAYVASGYLDNFTNKFLDALYAFCETTGLRFVIAFAQWCDETDRGRSSYWRKYRNPGGIGALPDGTYVGITYKRPEDSARALVIHLWVYARGPELPAILAPYVALDPRYQAAIDAGYAGNALRLEYLSNRWATNPNYATQIANHARWAFGSDVPEGASIGPDAPESEVPDMAEHRYGIGMGHRNINGGGANGEFAWTPSCARALAAAIEARGGEAYLFQEHDNDSDPNFSVGKGLQAAARVGSDTIVNRYGPLTAIFFCHYNGGGGAGAHFIYPDGWVAPDRGIDNPLDIKLATAIKRHLAKTNTVGFLGWDGWRGPERGVMSEKDTGAVAGRYGNRLGEMVGTIQHRATTPRLIIEAGSIDTSDRKYITNPAWVRHVYCEAIVDALEEVFGPMRAGQPQEPTPEPEKPESVYATPIERKWADDAIAAGVPFVVLQDKNHKAGYTRWWRVDRNYLTIAEVARQQVATDSSKFLNEPIPANTAIWVDFVGENYEGEPYGLTPWGTMVRMDNLRVIDWPDQPDLHAVDTNAVAETLTNVIKDALD